MILTLSKQRAKSIVSQHAKVQIEVELACFIAEAVVNACVVKIDDGGELVDGAKCLPRRAVVVEVDVALIKVDDGGEVVDGAEGLLHDCVEGEVVSRRKGAVVDVLLCFASLPAPPASSRKRIMEEKEANCEQQVEA